MKRKGNLYNQICSIENLRLADQIAQRGKQDQYGVKLHNRKRESNIFLLHESLLNKTYKTEGYSTFKIYEPKEREIYRLPYYPHRIVHHAVMNVLKPVFVSTFTKYTYSCIEGRGIHKALNDVKVALKNEPATRYCLKFDIKKFYPNVDHEILKQLLRRKFKDADLLQLLDNTIDSAPGIPIGNYLSQYFANFYLSYFDHWLREELGIKYCFRYADDIVILASNKQFLHKVLYKIKEYLTVNLKLTVKENYQVFPVASRGIDFLGYVIRHTHVLMRKTIKQNYARAIAKGLNNPSIPSYNGWAIHCDSINLRKKLFHDAVR